MVAKKEDVKKKETDLWNERLVEPIKLGTYAKEIGDTEKILIYGESGSGKTRWYMKIIEELLKDGLKPEDVLMCIIFSDRPTGITKLINMIPKEFINSVLLFPINNYEELISSTAIAQQKLEEHYKKTGKHGWLVGELINEPWVFAQDYYTRQAYGEGLANYFAEKKQLSKVVREDSSAYRALEGWKDWSVIKFFHNFNWIDKIKRMPYNVLFTSEIKEEGNKDSIFYDIGYRPSGEKDNMHRFDTILYLSHKGNKFSQACYKLTGYSKIYSSVDITNKNGYEVHKGLLKRLEDAGLRTSKIEDVEKEAGIDFKEEQKVKTKMVEGHHTDIKDIKAKKDDEYESYQKKMMNIKKTEDKPVKDFFKKDKTSDESPKEATTADTKQEDLPPVKEQKTQEKKEEEGDDWEF